MKRTVVFLIAFAALSALPQAATTISGRVEKIISTTYICHSPSPLGCGHSGYYEIINTLGPVPGVKIYLLTSATASGPYLKTDSAVTNSSGQYSFNIPLTGAGLYQVLSPRQTIGGTGYSEVIFAAMIVYQNDALTQNFLLNPEVPPSPPSGLSYSPNPVVYWTGAAINSTTPNIYGTTPIRFSVTPTLPAGIIMDTNSGWIHGTPSIVSPATNYTVTAVNSAGSTTAIVNITVSASIPPSNLSYQLNPAVYAVGMAFQPNMVTVQGSPPLTYSVSPALPAGLYFNTSGGSISGIPTASATAADYVVTVRNPAGSTTVKVNITVAVPSLNRLSYTTNPALYVVGTVIAPNLPTIQGSSAITFSVSPALPPGLILNTSTGTISGTPTAAKAVANYVVMASNPVEPTSATLSIQVNNPVKIVSLPDIRTFTLRISGSSTIVFSLPGDAQVGRLELLDAKGMRVWEAKSELVNGENTAVWNGKTKGQSVSGGLYIARIILMDAKQNRTRTLVQRVVYLP